METYKITYEWQGVKRTTYRHTFLKYATQGLPPSSVVTKIEKV